MATLSITAISAAVAGTTVGGNAGAFAAITEPLPATIAYDWVTPLCLI